MISAKKYCWKNSATKFDASMLENKPKYNNEQKLATYNVPLVASMQFLKFSNALIYHIIVTEINIMKLLPWHFFFSFDSVYKIYNFPGVFISEPQSVYSFYRCFV